MDADVKKIMDVQGSDGEKHPIYGDAFAAAAIADVLERLNDLEARAAQQQEQAYDA